MLLKSQRIPGIGILYLDRGGDWVDVDQLLHVPLVGVPQVVLASHAKGSEINWSKTRVAIWLKSIFLRGPPAIGKVTIACRATISHFSSVWVRRLSLEIC